MESITLQLVGDEFPLTSKGWEIIKWRGEGEVEVEADFTWRDATLDLYCLEPCWEVSVEWAGFTFEGQADDDGDVSIDIDPATLREAVKGDADPSTVKVEYLDIPRYTMRDERRFWALLHTVSPRLNQGCMEVPHVGTIVVVVSDEGAASLRVVSHGGHDILNKTWGRATPRVAAQIGRTLQDFLEAEARKIAPWL